jgi:hypothetical protein
MSRIYIASPFPCPELSARQELYADRERGSVLFRSEAHCIAGRVYKTILNQQGYSWMQVRNGKLVVNARL